MEQARRSGLLPSGVCFHIDQHRARPRDWGDPFRRAAGVVHAFDWRGTIPSICVGGGAAGAPAARRGVQPAPHLRGVGEHHRGLPGVDRIRDGGGGGARAGAGRPRGHRDGDGAGLALDGGPSGAVLLDVGTEHLPELRAWLLPDAGARPRGQREADDGVRPDRARRRTASRSCTCSPAGLTKGDRVEIGLAGAYAALA